MLSLLKHVPSSLVGVNPSLVRLVEARPGVFARALAQAGNCDFE